MAFRSPLLVGFMGKWRSYRVCSYLTIPKKDGITIKTWLRSSGMISCGLFGVIHLELLATGEEVSSQVDSERGFAT